MAMYIAYESADNAKKACLDDNRPLATICNRYIENGIICEAHRACELYIEGQIEHFMMQVRYKIHPNDEFTLFTMTM